MTSAQAKDLVDWWTGEKTFWKRPYSHRDAVVLW